MKNRTVSGAFQPRMADHDRPHSNTPADKQFQGLLEREGLGTDLQQAVTGRDITMTGLRRRSRGIGAEVVYCKSRAGQTVVSFDGKERIADQQVWEDLKNWLNDEYCDIYSIVARQIGSD